MKKLFLFGLGLFLIIIASCEEDTLDIEIDISSDDWKVVQIKKTNDLSYVSATENYILQFVNDSAFTFNLDVNTCGGQYKIISAGRIEFGNVYCTEMCCDSQYAYDLRQLILDMTSYYGKDNQLVLKGQQGEIVLESF